MTHDNLTATIAGQVRSVSGKNVLSATLQEYWQGTAAAVVDHLADNWQKTEERYNASRMQHYFSAEFLMGRALLNNLNNLGLVEEAEQALGAFGQNLSDVLEEEHDAALGNGGLGRLAACFLDSSATQNLPVRGYGILYRYGLFKQFFEDGNQGEEPDPWMEEGYPFVIRREENVKFINYADLKVRAIPYDMPITGYGTDNVGTLRLWKAEPMADFDYNAFNSQDFTGAIVERERVNDISRVLYPNDSSFEGKVLRVRQQYFFCSASLQQIVDNELAQRGTLKDFATFNSIQLNDTHPVLAIPELMRILMDDHDFGWDEAWEIVRGTFAYTNHTVLAEALETWEVSIFDRLFPRIREIIFEIDRRFREEMAKAGFDQGKIDYMAPVSGNRIRMAWIACYAAFSINGVAALHTEIIKADTLKDWYDVWPEKFNNKTNGVTPRRWLDQCNPRLSALLTELLGNDEWVRDLDLLKNLEGYLNDADVLDRLNAIKHANKVDFAAWIKHRQGIEVDPDAIFDTQIKRLHEYKRQLLNAFYILDLYFQIKDDPSMEVPPRVFIFGAKAAPGYVRAKAIIKLINTIGELVNNDDDVAGRLKVVFVENYNVSPAEHIIPATDISEQISTAGKEASGTGNMKFMMNGALTLGTMDGANVEIVDAVGNDNAYIFGATEDELPELRKTYDPRRTAAEVPGLQRVMDALVDGTLDDGGTGLFHDLHNSLFDGWGGADEYYVLGDFASYRETRDRVAADYFADRRHWAAMCLKNIIESGRFSSDRTIRDYAREVWKIEPQKI
ncbi:glycogen/starch/alpha-glucan family phosphorylase [Trueperella bernardiae]|uniref:Alpha-1,4 glucan phosphorylase n=1 Tax=Trueperella bernardiae TaxID=59561 RepID=A0AAW6ZMM7_9ACTO|nr:MULTISPECIES: glycogen/starch/alpha-glucan phosphorylase [Trueperella]MDK8602193.1 glycogen/starch/alpha-glucan phosphorylase [Trueperella bernardiae]MDV6238879.1 glycogen/starch/alpha-glucan phosphorylase [Trueperella bernardiae]OCW60803.1 glycogen phosphorylase [Trueperella bernardiae]OFS66802.1 glycogen phosphorylase [Trueperella sp. HMSC08H06]PKZ89530.1 glycogen/starch/alpha-glucan family phosphorylase [Trueperella bernardiae]